jgi:hypothetical protein
MNIYLLWLGLNELLVCEEKKFKYTIIFEIMNLGVEVRGGRVRDAVVIFWNKVC